MAYIVMAYMAIACMDMAYMVMANIAIGCIDMAYIVMVYILMTYHVDTVFDSCVCAQVSAMRLNSLLAHVESVVHLDSVTTCRYTHIIPCIAIRCHVLHCYALHCT